MNRTIESNTASEDLRSRVAELEKRVRELEAERDELKGWKAEQLAVENTWDAQAVGELIGCKWGDGIREKIEPFIKDIIAERDGLKAELERVPVFYQVRCDDIDELRARHAALVDALKLAKLGWYGGHLPNEWYTTVTKDYESKEFQGMTIGQVVSKLAALEVKP